MATTIKTMPTGPYIVEGEFELTAADGQVKPHQGRVALCRCGASKNKPFCDGTHRSIGFCETAAAQEAKP